MSQTEVRSISIIIEIDNFFVRLGTNPTKSIQHNYVDKFKLAFLCQ